MVKALKNFFLVGCTIASIMLLAFMFWPHNTNNSPHESTGSENLKLDNSFKPRDSSTIRLSHSDTYSKKMVEVIANGMDLTPYLVKDNIIRKFVIFISHLAKGNLHYPTLPTQRPEEELKVETVGSELYIADENFYRYKIYALALNQISAEQVALTYKLMTPLLNEAFQELGQDDISFHKTFIKALNVIISAPATQKKMQLQKVNQQYHFKNSKLESLTPIQKLMIRMGPENSVLIQKKASSILHAIEKEH